MNNVNLSDSFEKFKDQLIRENDEIDLKAKYEKLKTEFEKLKEDRDEWKRIALTYRELQHQNI